jgi:serine/threonine-protein kinase
MSQADIERLNTALVGRYTIEREIGRGGMATVYLARDLRHRRRVAIKVLHPELASSLGSERFLREIEIVAGLSHPHILPLFDSGEADGFLFYVMPYVEGESLRDRLNREKGLPLDEALGIIREVMDALSYAHSRDLLHRDIKPENILLEAGHARVADFGIARAVGVAGADRLTETGVSIGTPGYMSPEQAMAEELDARSDIYSLACVLYEMLVGEPPYTGPTPQSVIARQLADPVPPLRTVRDTVPDSIERAVEKALAKMPVDRFATVWQFADALGPTASTPAPDQARRKRRRSAKPRLAWLAAIVVLATAAGAVMLYPSTPIPFDERDWIVISDLENETGDSIFDGSLKTAFTIGIEQSRHVNVLPRSRVAVVLEMMMQEDVAKLTEPMAREVALRTDSRVLVVPGINAVDSVYTITTRIIDPADGRVLKSRSVRASGKAEVLPALDKLARRLRRDLGESILSVAQRGVRLHAATTSSLEALSAWSEGNTHWNSGRYDAAGVLYNRAVALDSGFAMAHASLGHYFYWWGNDRPRGDRHFDAALALLDRVTERERLVIEASINGYRGNQNEQINALEIYTASYPDDLIQRYNLGTAYMRASRYDKAIATLEQVIDADSSRASAYINVATSYAMLGEHEKALPRYLKAFELEPAWLVNDNLNHEFGFNYVGMGDLEAAEQTFRRMLSASQRQQARGHRSLALLKTFSGQHADAIQHLEQAILLNRTLESPLSEFRDRLYLAAALRAKGAMQGARDELEAAHQLADSAQITPDWLMILAKQLARDGLVEEAIAVQEVATARQNPDNRNDRAAIELIAGEILLARGDFGEAIRRLEIASTLFPRSNYHLESVAYGHLADGDLDAAQSKYQELLTRRDLAAEAQEYWILAHYRLGQIHAEKGDTAGAAEYYRRFLDIWAKGDDDLVALRDARNWIQALRGPG